MVKTKLEELYKIVEEHNNNATEVVDIIKRKLYKEGDRLMEDEKNRYTGQAFAYNHIQHLLADIIKEL